MRAELAAQNLPDSIPISVAHARRGAADPTAPKAAPSVRPAFTAGEIFPSCRTTRGSLFLVYSVPVRNFSRTLAKPAGLRSSKFTRHAANKRRRSPGDSVVRLFFFCYPQTCRARRKVVAQGKVCNPKLEQLSDFCFLPFFYCFARELRPSRVVFFCKALPVVTSDPAADF